MQHWLLSSKPSAYLDRLRDQAQAAGEVQLVAAEVEGRQRCPGSQRRQQRAVGSLRRGMSPASAGHRNGPPQELGWQGLALCTFHLGANHRKKSRKNTPVVIIAEDF